MNNTRTTVRNTVSYIVIIIMCLGVFFPFLWMVSSSFKALPEVFMYPIQWIPKTFHWENYKKLIDFGFLNYYSNSLKVTLSITIIQGLTSSLAGYSFAKLRFPGRDKFFYLYIATMMIPSQIMMIPQFIIMGQLHLINTHMALILLGAFSPYTVFLMRQYFITMPSELIESARIDGCGELATFFKIALPLAKPVVATMVIFIIMAVWNDMMTPLIYIHKLSLKTIPLGLLDISSQYGVEMHLVMAGSCLAILPILLAYIFGQRSFIDGIMMGAVKG